MPDSPVDLDIRLKVFIKRIKEKVVARGLDDFLYIFSLFS